MEVLFVLLGLLLLIAIIWDVTVICVVGRPKTDEEILEFLEIIKNNKPDENEYNKDIDLINSVSHMYKSKIIDKNMISTFQQNFMSKSYFMSKSLPGITFKWYIKDLGIVPRWYKSHSEIEKFYNELKNK